ncbi:ATP synthase subunit I [Accumulibacter sp.]|uniref:ATP synthase subunit I n=1 Tax=Accumulibacter sp. TaxID=2053492 RepID=UPI001ACD0992|nr:ATP synthase subunit I [Accumulibacter sp.]MBN8515080.1 ATP synthase subunit I [Accumulibacter sp.]MBO3703625.1 ATP synthase subunit I [Accumulibacter sp.]HRI90091.1 ATP synthase subunit I [Accumulibacter sp.]
MISSKESCSACVIDAAQHSSVFAARGYRLQGRFCKGKGTFLHMRFDSSIGVWYPARVLEGLVVHSQVRWFFRCQAVVTLVAALIAGLALGVDAAVSAALGGGIAIASALAYVWRGLRPTGTAVADAKKAFSSQLAAEGYKFAVTLLLFALVFKGYAQLAALPLFLAYAATIVVYWMALLRQH